MLKMLSRQGDAPLPAALLGSKLGIDRVSVREHMRKLQELGYAIRSTSTGYRLLPCSDSLFPWEFPRWETQFEHFPLLDSTMRRAKELAKGGCPHFTIVAADRQTAGRGRMGRSWLSEQGGLHFTVVTRPDIAPKSVNRLGFAASVCLVRSLYALYGVETRIKWPNDILLQNRKLCGILCEMEVEADSIRFLNIGIGINVNSMPEGRELDAVSIRQILGRKVHRRDILNRFLEEFEAELEHNRYEELLSEWKRYAATLNKRVRVVTYRDTIEGRAIGIDDSGALLVELPDKTCRKIFYGDCFHTSVTG